MLATNVTSYSPPIGYHCWPPMLHINPHPSSIKADHQCYPSAITAGHLCYLTSLPPAITAGHLCYLSLPSHWLSMLATNATPHFPPTGYQRWPPMLPLTPLPSAITAGHQCYWLSMLATTATSTPPTQETDACNTCSLYFLANAHPYAYAYSRNSWL